MRTFIKSKNKDFRIQVLHKVVVWRLLYDRNSFYRSFLFKTNIRRNLWAEKKSLSIFKILKVISV
ncbi:hypothetical protein LEP1GSC158_5004 [Leptospira interrogans serovar Zanoni str. LT2156]|uniref:Uncharacterized protein n=2 Tax=Leptospira interrogans TaxID=173 RepID=M6HEB2_LEPIR|nr:hypothetical protein LEP1GSC158_5004 [Leptospira interrogans serovar Zanoni str. LT2156]QCO38710.1 hypothetical protein E4412_17195 [Leptospira interrogans]